jgi:monothiol glutaredoxin
MEVSESLRKRLDELIQSDRVVLFMKGTRRMPQCGFSNSVVQILDGIVESYTTVDVLSDNEIREGIKAYSSWPTIPQLYIAGEFVGGADIVREMADNGELAQKIGVSSDEPAAPRIMVSPLARKAFEGASAEAGGDPLRFEVSPRFEYGLFFGPRAEGDVEADAGGFTILLDRASARRADGVTIDFVEGPEGAGFKIDNPNEPPKVKAVSARKLKELLDAGEVRELFDVRTDAERQIAKIEGARPLDAAAQAYLEGLPKDTPIAFHCHHGVRSRSAAEHFLGKGFKIIYNLEGGIDAWSASVDPSVPRY